MHEGGGGQGTEMMEFFLVPPLPKLPLIKRDWGDRSSVHNCLKFHPPTLWLFLFNY